MNFEPKRFHGLFQYNEFGILPREITICCFEVEGGAWVVEIKGISANIQDILLNLMPKVKKVLEAIEIKMDLCEIFVFRDKETIKLIYENDGDFNYSLINDYKGKCKCNLETDSR